MKSSIEISMTARCTYWFTVERDGIKWHEEHEFIEGKRHVIGENIPEGGRHLHDIIGDGGVMNLISTINDLAK